MVATDDANDMAGQVDRARKNLANATIDERDRAAISAFADHREITDEVKLSTLRDDIADCRRLAERSTIPLLEFDSLKDVNAVLKINRSSYNISPSTNDNYRKELRLFFAWLHDDPDYGDYEWWDQIEIPTRDTDPIQPDEILSTAEVRTLRDTAAHARDKALIEFLADTGLRITAALQLRRGDVSDIDTRRPTVAVNQNGTAQKDMDTLPRPIIQSAQPLRTYLNEFHPDDHPKAALFAARRYGKRDRANGAIAPSTALNRMKDTASEAGIDRDKVNNHAFRHVAVTRMRRDMKLDWDDIAHRTGWSNQSLSRMKSLYAHLSNEDKNDRIWQAVGVESDADDPEPLFTPCKNCGVDLPSTTRICGECGADQSAAWREQKLRRALGSLDEATATRLIDAVEQLEES